jgi:hypothetical protein
VTANRSSIGDVAVIEKQMFSMSTQVDLFTDVQGMHYPGNIANAVLVAVRLRNRKGGGCIYFDKSLKETRHGRHIYHNKWCAEITVNNVRYRHRSKSRSACEEFISEMQLKHSIR